MILCFELSQSCGLHMYVGCNKMGNTVATTYVRIWKQGLEYDIVISNMLIDRYVEFHFFLWDGWNGCGDNKERTTWNNVIAGTTLLNMCMNVAFSWRHSIWLWLQNIISWTTLNSGSADNGWVYGLEEAFTPFSKQHNRDVVSYNTMPSRYVRNNKGFSALHSHDVWYVHVY